MLSDKHLEKVMNWEAPERLVLGDTQNVRFQTEEQRVARAIKRVANLVKAVVECKQPLFGLQHRHAGKIEVVAYDHGEKLAKALVQVLPKVEEYFPCNSMNPYLELLMSEARLLPVPELLSPGLKHVPSHVATIAVTQLNALVDSMRQRARTEEFKREVDNRRRKCDKNQRAAQQYVDAIFELEASKNLVIRLDLTCGSEQLERRGILASVDAVQAREELDKFMRHVRATYPLTGYLGCMECGLLTGYHFHLVIFLDGHWSKGGIWIAQQLGEHWRHFITEGRGRYDNGNLTSKYKGGVGMIEHDDLFGRKILMEKVIGYLTKIDFWWKFTGVKKKFFKGRMPVPRAPDEPRLGRPRRGASEPLPQA